MQSSPASSPSISGNGSQETMRLLDEADKLCDTGEYSQAIELYDKALQKDSNEIIYNNKGVALDALERHEEAVRCYDSALDLAPNYVTAWHNKGNSLAYLGRYKEAIECYDEAISLDNTYYEPYFDKALAHAAMGERRKAKKSAEEGVRYGEGDPDILKMLMGEILNEIGAHRDALKIFDEILDGDEDNIDVWKRRGDTLFNLGMLKDAHETYDLVLSLDPDDEEIWNNKGYVLFSTGRYLEATSCYLKALEIYPRFGSAHYNLAYLYHTQGDYKSSVFHYKEASKSDPHNEVLWNNLGNALYNMEKYDECVPFFLRAIEVNPDYAIAWNNIGNSLDKLGKYEDSLEYHRKAIELRPDMDYFHFALGYALAKTGSEEKGLEEVNISIDLNPKNEKAWFTKATILKMLGMIEDTFETLDEVIRLDPNHADAWVMRGVLLEDLGKYEESLRAYEEALKAYERNFKNFGVNGSLISKGELLHELGRTQEALQTYKRLIKLDKSYELGWIKEIEMLIETGQYRDAVVDSNRAAEIFEDPILYVFRGRAYSGMGNHEKAHSSFQIALKSDGEDARIAFARYLSDIEDYDIALLFLNDESWEERLLRGNIFLEKGDNEQAKELFKELMKEKENSVRASYGLGVALSELGDVKGAHKAFDVCIGISEDFEPAWYKKAILYMQSGNKKKALEYARILYEISSGEYPKVKKLIKKLESEII